MAAGLALGLSMPLGSAIFGAGTAPTNSVAPAITGTLVAGTVQTCSTGTWANSPTLYAYQWVLGSYPGAPILGATSSTYTPTSGQVGMVLGCIVTASNGAGAASANATGGGTITAASSGSKLAFNVKANSMYVPLISARDIATVTTNSVPIAR